MIDKIGLAIITLFGIGNIKYAPGTVASFVTCLIYLPVYIYKPNFIIIIVIFFIVSIYSIILIDKLSNHFRKKDPEEIVIDEFIGQSIPIIIIYSIFRINEVMFEEFFTNFIPLSFLILFVLFRFFDILKPFPINLVDKKMKNGFGIVLDDVIAGIFTTILYFIGYYFYYS